MVMDLGSALFKLAAKSDVYGPNIFGWLVTAGSFGLLALIFAFLKLQRQASLNWVKATAREKKKAWKKLKCPTSCHSWTEAYCHSEQPSACCVPQDHSSHFHEIDGT